MFWDIVIDFLADIGEVFVHIFCRKRRKNKDAELKERNER